MNNRTKASNDSMLFQETLSRFQCHYSSKALLEIHNNKINLQDFLELDQIIFNNNENKAF
jgi:hypothetical protein